jgi:signal transduction protein with GAF and PtsI domain
MGKKGKKDRSLTKQIEALSEISKVITSERYLDDILKLIVIVTAKVMNSKICSLMLLDEKTNTLQIRATQSMHEEYIKKPPLKLGEGIAGKVAKENKPMVVYDVRKEEEYKYKDIAKKAGIVSLLSVPLAVKGKVIGVLNLYTSRPHKFTKTEIDMLTAVANQAAIAIENAQLLVKTKLIQEELETRKKVERAKGILMKRLNLGEEEAYRLIQKYSMDKQKSMKEIAEAIIIAHEVQGKI